jgi:glycine/serine hydroxymethyltransferase
MVNNTQTDKRAEPVDEELEGLLRQEERRQLETFTLIPSENYTSKAVLEATGSVLTNKYSEGYPGKRYYEGQVVIDQVESLAISRAKAIFGVDHVNVQPYSGSPANLAIYLAFAKPGDTIMGMAVPMGGHLTHGWNVSVTGLWFNSVQYGVRKDTGRVDLDEVREIALREHPKLIFCGGTAIPRTIDFEGFASIAREVDAVLVADIAHIAGLVAGDAHPSPVGHAPVISTTTHKTLRGPRGAMLMCAEEYAKQIDWDPTQSQRSPIARDTILTNVTIYWFTETAGSAARLYLEAAAQAWGDRPAPSAVPSGVASFLCDRAVRGLAELSNTITHWSQFPTGGHFASLQAPELLVTDIREFFRTVRP